MEPLVSVKDSTKVRSATAEEMEVLGGLELAAKLANAKLQAAGVEIQIACGAPSHWVLTPDGKWMDPREVKGVGQT